MTNKKINPLDVTPYCVDYCPYPESRTYHTKKEKYELFSASYWDKFYKKNKDNFFKDRHWITREFPELSSPSPSSSSPTILEIGCGVGNTTIPLLSQLKDIFLFSFDFSAEAVELMTQREGFDPKRCKWFVLDITKEELPEFVPLVDFVVIVFVLSAIAPEWYLSVVQKVYKALRPGGMVFLRDYGRGDLAELRFERKQHKSKLGDNFYVRHDGTRAYYFTLEEMEKLFLSDCGGFEVVENMFVQRKIENKKEDLKMDRIWIQSKFRKK